MSLAFDLETVRTTRLFRFQADLPRSTLLVFSFFLLQFRATSPAIREALAEVMDDYGDHYTQPVEAATLSQVTRQK